MAQKKSQHRSPSKGAAGADADDLFRRYAGRLIALARSRLPRTLGPHVDPEDVVHSAYRSFFLAARDGRYEARQGTVLWQLLVTFTLHKLYRQVERLATQKRAVTLEEHFGSEDSLLGLKAQIATREPSPVEAMALVDEVEQAMRGLQPAQRRILELRLQGFTLDEIASTVGCTERTVRRVLEGVKQQLEERQAKESK